MTVFVFQALSSVSAGVHIVYGRLEFNCDHLTDTYHVASRVSPFALA